MTSKIQLLLDEWWDTIEKNQKRLEEYTASRGLPPPPPLPARLPLPRPPPKPFAPKPFLHQISSSSASKKRTIRHQQTTYKTKPKRPSSTTSSAPPTSPKPAPKPTRTITKHGTHTNRFLALNNEAPKAVKRRVWKPPWRLTKSLLVQTVSGCSALARNNPKTSHTTIASDNEIPPLPRTRQRATPLQPTVITVAPPPAQTPILAPKPFVPIPTCQPKRTNKPLPKVVKSLAKIKKNTSTPSTPSFVASAEQFLPCMDSQKLLPLLSITASYTIMDSRSPTSIVSTKPNLVAKKQIIYNMTRREWRPPWRPVETAPNAAGRLEWRPPWRHHSVLEDKNVLRSAGMIRDYVPMGHVQQ